MSNSLIIGKPSEAIRAIAEALTAVGCECERADGDASAIRRLRRQSFDVVITDPETTVEEDLALLDELRDIRPGVKAIVLAPYSTPEEVIAALRARVFACLTAPYDPEQITRFAVAAAADTDWQVDIEVLSAEPEWVSLRVNCRRLTADRVVSFLDELHSEVPHALRRDLLLGFREILLKAMEKSKALNEFKVVEVSAVRTRRTLVFYVRDTISTFHRRGLAQAAIAGAVSIPVTDAGNRELLAVQQERYATLVTQGIVDELICSELGGELLLIKHTE